MLSHLADSGLHSPALPITVRSSASPFGGAVAMGIPPRSPWRIRHASPTVAATGEWSSFSVARTGHWCSNGAGAEHPHSTILQLIRTHRSAAREPAGSPLHERVTGVPAVKPSPFARGLRNHRTRIRPGAFGSFSSPSDSSAPVSSADAQRRAFEFDLYLLRRADDHQETW